MKTDYIPGRNSDFHGFQQFLTDQVTLNLATWGIPADVGAELTSQNTAYNALYAAIFNKEVRTPQQVEAHRQGRRTYTAFLRQLVQGYLVNNPVISFDEKRAMGLNPRDGRNSRPQITVMPVPTLRALGGGMVRFEFRVPGDSNRASIHPASNGVEVKVYFSGGGRPMPPMPPMPDQGDTVNPPDNQGRQDAHEVHTVLRTRAIFVEEVGNQGRTMHLQARYVNTSHPQKSGPWCNEVTVVVS